MDGVSVCQDIQSGIVVFQRFDEALRHAVSFRTAHRREQQFETKGSRHIGDVLCNVGAAVVRQAFDGMRGSRRPEPPFDGGDHEVAHHLAGDADVGDR